MNFAYLEVFWVFQGSNKVHFSPKDRMRSPLYNISHPWFQMFWKFKDWSLGFEPFSSINLLGIEKFENLGIGGLKPQPLVLRANKRTIINSLAKGV